MKVIGKTRTNQPVESDDVGFKSAVADAVSGQGVDNAKPIYCHPISLVSAGFTRLTLFVFNNDETPFTKTTFLNWLDALYTSVGSQTRVLISGAFPDTLNNVCIASYMGKFDGTTYYLLGVKLSGEAYSQSYTREEIETLIYALYDGVNKIN